MLSNETLIQNNLILPDHNEELSKAETIIEKLKNKLKIIQTQKRINDKIHTQTYEEIIRVLDYLGRLSMPAFNIEDQLEALYTKQYIHTPELAKKLWLDHYDKILHPYSLLKNRCFRLLDELDTEYIKRNKQYPPNWKI
jgi:hypothetical protein